jgi:hypothetical protein
LAISVQGAAARGEFREEQIEPIEDVEIFEDWVTIACHRQDAK